MKLSDAQLLRHSTYVGYGPTLWRGSYPVMEIAKRQDVSVKYLEQIIIPLKKAGYIKSVRGPKGGHILTKPPNKITVGEIVALLEDSTCLVECCEDIKICKRIDICPTRLIWKEVSEMIFDRMHTITLAELVERAKAMESKELNCN